MAYFQTKNPNLGKFWRDLLEKILVIFTAILVYFTAIWYILWPFGIYFRLFGMFYPRFGLLYQEKLAILGPML
jgi:uncharacterized membrane protein HdeD (DUF308 family)